MVDFAKLLAESRHRQENRNGIQEPDGADSNRIGRGSSGDSDATAATQSTLDTPSTGVEAAQAHEAAQPSESVQHTVAAIEAAAQAAPVPRLAGLRFGRPAQGDSDAGLLRVAGLDGHHRRLDAVDQSGGGTGESTGPGPAGTPAASIRQPDVIDVRATGNSSDPAQRPTAARFGSRKSAPAADQTIASTPVDASAGSAGSNQQQDSGDSGDAERGESANAEATGVSGPSVHGGGGVKPRLAGLAFNSGSKPSDPIPGPISAGPILSLDALDSTEAGAVEARPTASGFIDETPAVKPTRTLPEGLEKQGLQFVQMLDQLYNPDMIHDTELMANVIRSMMIEMKSQRQYMKLIAPEDVNLLVRTMRNSMGLARIKKQEKKAGTRTSRKSAKVDEDMLGDLDSLIGKLGIE